MFHKTIVLLLIVSKETMELILRSAGHNLPIWRKADAFHWFLVSLEIVQQFLLENIPKLERAILGTTHQDIFMNWRKCQIEDCEFVPF